MIEGPVDAHALAAVHGQVVDLVRCDPLDLCRLRAGCRVAAHIIGAVDDGELLADLVVAGVVDDVPGVGEDAGDPGRPDVDAGLLERSRGQRKSVMDSPGSWAPPGMDQLPLSLRRVRRMAPSRRTKAAALGLMLLAGGASGSS